MNGAPTYFYYFANLNNDVNQVWSLIESGINNKYLIGADTGASNNFGLVTFHAYTILG